jgi:hypothetical protein
MLLASAGSNSSFTRLAILIRARSKYCFLFHSQTFQLSAGHYLHIICSASLCRPCMPSTLRCYSGNRRMKKRELCPQGRFCQ